MVSETRKTGAVGRKGEFPFQASLTSRSLRWLSTCWSRALHFPPYYVICDAHVSL